MNMRSFFLLVTLMVFGVLTAQEIHECRYTVSVHEDPQLNCPPVAQWNRFITRYTSTCIPAMVVGVSCGAACRFTDQFVFWPIDWLLWRGIRNGIGASVKKSMKECKVECDDFVFDQVCLVSAWISYFACLKDKKMIY